MIVTQTPLRISFFGGGTDFPDFFLKEGGCVLSAAINKYIFVIIKKRFDSKIRVGYTKTELVDDIDEIQHELVRECLRKTGIRKGVEIATMADVPSSGSGLGSSSSVTVGLLNAMYQYLAQPRHLESLAREACEIEITTLRKPIGMQDQYIASYGGQRFISFGPEDRVTVESAAPENGHSTRLNQNLMLFFTNTTRKAETILCEQATNISARTDVLKELKRTALVARECLRSGSFDEFGLLLDKAWQLKKQLASKISNNSIDHIYQSACKAGALGGKITGAGGGGFLLLYCRPHRQDDVRAVLRNLPELSFAFERSGTKIIFDDSR
ncbi:MAG: GHMP kinase [Acidobacteriota bacterium]